MDTSIQKQKIFSYRQILKAATIFGGVQVINILIQILRSKIIAVFLGPEGMGIIGILNSATAVISRLTNFGLGTSAVKYISEANASGNNERVSVTILVLRRMVWLTGIVGSLVTLIFASQLSQISFGNRDYTIALRWLSITLLLSQISSGQVVLLQGLQKIKYLANANLTGALLGLAISLPIYFLMGLDGIVPAIIASSIFAMLRSWYFARKVRVIPVEVSMKETWIEGKNMMTLGFMLGISGLISQGAFYIIRIFINNTGGINEVGIYNAGYAIINTYLGLIFTAMGTDYYPRLSAVSGNIGQCRQLINNQAEISSLVMAPIAISFLIFINWVVLLLFSNKFAEVETLIIWGGLGMLFKAASWPVGYMLLAKANSKVFFFSELSANIYILFFNILGYKMFGLTGLGIAFMLSNLLLLIQVYLIIKYLYGFDFNKDFIIIFIIQVGLTALTLTIKLITNGTVMYLLGIILIVISIAFSYKELDKRIEVKSILHKFLKRLRHGSNQ